MPSGPGKWPGICTAMPPFPRSFPCGMPQRAFPPIAGLTLLGIQNLEKGCGAEDHNERFDIDEDALDMGVQVTVGYVRSLMDHGLPV